MTFVATFITPDDPLNGFGEEKPDPSVISRFRNRLCALIAIQIVNWPKIERPTSGRPFNEVVSREVGEERYDLLTPQLLV